MAYSGIYKCPKCRSSNTESDCIATSDYWMQFTCGECGHEFKKVAARVSPYERPWHVRCFPCGQVYTDSNKKKPHKCGACGSVAIGVTHAGTRDLTADDPKPV